MHTPSDFSLQINSALLLERPSVNDVASVSRVLLNTLGPAWEKPLAADLRALWASRGYAEHPFFWTPEHCNKALRYLRATYLIDDPDVVPEKHWSLPDGGNLDVIGDRLYYRRGDARYLVAHCYNADFGTNPFSCGINDTIENWLQDVFGYSVISQHWFSNRLTHAKTMDGAKKRLTVIAERVVELFGKYTK